MPTNRSTNSAQDRASFYAAMDETRTRGSEMLDAVRESRARHLQAVQSLAVERRILREDFAHWDDEST